MNAKAYKTLAVFIAVVVIAFVIFEFAQAPQTEDFLDRGLAILPGDDAKVILGKQNLTVNVARTAEERSRGLSGVESLSENRGLLFVFVTPGKYGFWMKDMNFPIDIVWIDERMRVAHIENNVSPNTYPTNFTPSQDALYVLEVNAGIVEKAGVSVGDTVVIEGL
jgi:uncharacterized membrane protein (UPF0127 family)